MTEDDNKDAIFCEFNAPNEEDVPLLEKHADEPFTPVGSWLRNGSLAFRANGSVRVIE